MHAGYLDTASYRAQDNLGRGRAIAKSAASFLDTAVPLVDASHGDVVCYSVETIWRKAECIATLADGCRVKLRDAWQFIGYTGRDPVQFLLFRNNGLHIEVQVDIEQPIVTVEANGKADILRRCLNRMWEIFRKDDKTQTRGLHVGRIYTAVDGSQVTLPVCSSYRFAN